MPVLFLTSVMDVRTHDMFAGSIGADALEGPEDGHAPGRSHRLPPLTKYLWSFGPRPHVRRKGSPGLFLPMFKLAYMFH